MHEKISRSNVQDILELSLAQKGILFHYVSEEQENLYNVQLSFRVQGAFDINMLQKAWKLVQAGNDALRAVFRWEKVSTPIQIILNECNADFTSYDLSQCSPQEQEEQLSHHLLADRLRRFDLNYLPIRFTIIKTGEESCLLIITNHHIVYDGWSNGLFLKSLFYCYQELVHERTPVLEPQPSFKEVLGAMVKKKEDSEEKDFWTNYLSDLIVTPVTAIRPLAGSNDLSVAKIKRAAGIDALENFSKKHRVTKAACIYAAYAILLHKMNYSESVAFGTPVSNRSPEIRGSGSVIGNFINVLPLSVTGFLRKTLLDIAVGVQTDLVARSEFHNSSLYEIKQYLGFRGSDDLFDSSIGVENYPLDESLVSGLQDVGIQLHQVYENPSVPLSITVFFKDNLEIEFTYKTTRLDDARVNALADHLMKIIGYMVADPQKMVDELSLLSANEKDQLVYFNNDTAFNYAREKSIVALFTEQAARYPDRPILVCNGESITYRELDSRSNQAAHSLMAMGLKKGDVAALMMEPSVSLIISMLAILKCGGAYLPIDLQWPAKRVGMIYAEAGCHLLVTQSTIIANLPDTVNSVMMDKLSYHHLPADAVDVSIDAGDLLYVIYTSGTTGVPKGVMISHNNLQNYISWARDYIGIIHSDKTVLVTSFAFDLGYTSIFSALLGGAELHLLSRDVYTSPPALIDYLREYEITYLKMTPSLYATIINEPGFERLSALRTIVLGGERIRPADVEKTFRLAPHIDMINHYGPTETTVGCIARRIDNNDVPEFCKRPTIGKPLYNTQCYILDKNHQALPVGFTGELYISGEGVGKGYMRQEALTQERFIPNPFLPHQTMYKTGDLARWLPEGNIEYIGRVDQQVKLNGYRIELNEIQKALSEYPFIQSAVVVVGNVNRPEGYLVAYYVAGKEIPTEELRSFLSTRLPEYMVPAWFVHLKKLPLTVNGKLDHAALPEPAVTSQGTYEPAVSMEEQVLVQAWSKILGANMIGITDNFFMAGGDSIKAIQISALVRQQGYETNVRDIFASQTIKVLAKKLKRTKAIADQSAVTGQVYFTPVQQWFLKGRIQYKHHYNQSVLLNFKEGLSLQTITAVLQAITDHHDALRTIFKQQNGLLVQQVQPPGLAPAVKEYDLLSEGQPGKRLTELCNKVQAGIDLETGPLIKAALFHLPDGTRLLLVIHHLVIDAVSWRFLFEDIDSLCRQSVAGAPFTLPLKTTSFLHWARALLKYASGSKYLQNKAYWDGLPSQTGGAIPRDYLQATSTFADKREMTVHLTAADTRSLIKDANAAFNTQINDLLLTAWLLTIHKQYGLSDVWIELEGHGREPVVSGVDISRTVGWFTSIYPVLLKKSGTSLADCITEVKATLRTIPEKGFDYLLTQNEVMPATAATAAHSKGGGIKFNYLGQFDTDTKDKIFDIAVEDKGHETALHGNRPYDWELVGMVRDGQLEMTLQYSIRQYAENNMRQLMELYQQQLVALVHYCCNCTQKEQTASDFTWKEISVAQLKQLQSRYDLQELYPLSPMQEGLLFHVLMDKQSFNYFEQKTVQLKGRLIPEIVEKCLQQIVDRYEALRTAIIYDGVQKPFQIVLKTTKADFIFRDLRQDCKKDSRREVLDQWQQQDRLHGFNLSQAPLTRVLLLQTADDEFDMIWSHHHIIMDGWCMGLIWNDFRLLYEGYVQRQMPLLAPVNRYSAYILWLQSRTRSEALAFWKQYLSGYELQTGFPAIQSVPDNRPTQEKQTLEAAISSELTNELQQLSASYGVTLYTILQTAWGVLLSNYNNTDDVVFGSVVSGRSADVEGIDKMVGLFINTIPVRIRFNADDKVAAVLLNVHQQALDNEKYHYTALSDIQSCSVLGSALFDHILMFENYPLATGMRRRGSAQHQFSEFEVTGIEVFAQNNYDLTVVFVQDKELSITIAYNPIRYDRILLQRLLVHFQRILQLFIQNSTQPVSALDILPINERNELLAALDHTQVEYPRNKTITALFAEQVKKTPDHIAVKMGNESITYAQLDTRSTSLAWLLKQYEVGHDSTVALLTDRCIETIVGMLAVLKAGGAYVPIDVDYPKERKEYLLADSGACVLLTTSAYTNDDPLQDLPVIVMDRMPDSTAAPEPLPEMNDSAGLCYIIYTSGTTGKPKGVMIEHRNVVRLLFNNASRFDFSQSDVWTMFHSHCFDFSVWEIYGALLFGGKLVVIPKMIARDPQAFLKVLAEEHVTVLNQTPAAFDNLVKEEVLQSTASLNLRYVIFGGEALHPGKLKTWHLRYPHTRLVNMYGITETTVHVTYKEITPLEIQTNKSNIGVPIPTLSIYLLNRHQQPVPKGCIGEIYVGGAGLARGYRGNNTLTEARFVADPFKPGEKLYRSGDLARLLDSGEMEYLGRVDDQVKIRGYRIELGEIENNLANYPEVKETIVCSRKKEDHQYLVAYYVADAAIELSALTTWLSEKLPDFMVPAYFVHLTAVQLTVNGKIDRKLLPEPQLTVNNSCILPKTAEEITMTHVWREVLGSEKIGVTDNFFLLGGDSIKSIQIISRLRNQGYDLSVKDIFTHPTIRELAGKLKKLLAVANQSAVTGQAPLTPVQQWLFNGPIVHKHHFNQSVALNFSNGIDAVTVRDIFITLMNHHDALRIVVKEAGGSKLLVNEAPNAGVNVEEHNLQNRTDAETTYLAICNDIQASFDLSKCPLIKPVLFHMNGGSRLVIIAHHLVIDTVSWQILLEDIDTLYRNPHKSGSPALPLKADAFLSWAQKWHEYSGSLQFQKTVDYWNAFPGRQVMPLTPDNPAAQPQLNDRQSSSFRLNDRLTAQLLKQTHFAFNTKVVDLLLCAFILAVKECYHIDSLLVDLEAHGREPLFPEINISRTIGWFTSIYPLCLTAETTNLQELIPAIKETARRVPNNGVDYLLYRSMKKNDLTNRQRAAVSFNYLGEIDNSRRNYSFQVSRDTPGAEVNEGEAWAYDWDITGMVAGGELQMTCRYSNLRYKSATMNALVAAFEKQLSVIINYCTAATKATLTPSDLTYKNLSIEELNTLQQRFDLKDVYSLSPMQEGLLFHALHDVGTVAYFEQVTARVEASLDIAAVEKCMDELTNRYDVLRTAFIHKSFARPLQIVLNERKIDFSYADISRQHEQDRVIREYQQKDKERPFDFSIDPLMRLTVLRLSDAAFIFIWSHHHILMDGWCMGILINEFRQLYAAHGEKGNVQLPAVRPYANYIEWLESRDRSAAAGYWKRYLENHPGASPLPGKQRQPGGSSIFDLRCERFEIDETTFNFLKNETHELGVTVNTIIQCAWALVLGKYNNTTDVTFASIVSGRPPEIDGIEAMVGLFINAIPVRISYDANTVVAEWLRVTQQQALQTVPYSYIPLAETQALGGLARNAIDHLIIFEDYPFSVGNDAGNGTDGLIFSDVQVFEQTHYDLAVTVMPGKTFTIRLDYNANMFKAGFIKQLAAHFKNSIRQLAMNKNALVAAVPITDEEEQFRLLHIFNKNEPLSFDRHQLFAQLFETQALRSGSSIAARHNGTFITYSELYRRAMKVADWLRCTGMAGNAKVAIYMPRSIDMLISIIGVFFAGGAYVPIETDYPAARVSEILTDSEATIVITDTDSISDALTWQSDIPTLQQVCCIEQLVQQTGSTIVPVHTKPEDLAYMIYTSGTTGKPKGVQITQLGMLNHLFAKIQDLGITESDSVAQTASCCFDISVWQFLAALLRGGQVCIIDKADVMDSRSILKLLDEQRITIFESVPWLMVSFLESMDLENRPQLKNLRWMIPTGEALQVGLVKKWYDLYPLIPLLNAYGPTEAGDDVTHYVVPHPTEQTLHIPIGKPVCNMRVYILDNEFRLCGPHMQGMICVAGPGVGKGYWKNEEKTRLSFLSNPFSLGHQDYDVLYMTGDIGYYQEDGLIVCLGRADEQVKLRGYRIEPAEIAHHLGRYETIKESVVVVKQLLGEATLVAYYTAEEEIPERSLRKHLQEWLPEYMVPSYFLRIDEIPVTANGKLNRQALPEPAVRAAACKVASNVVEEKLVDIWSEVLRIDRNLISIDHSFFELGGHSLRATALAGKIHQQFGIDVPLRAIFTNESIEQLAEYIQTVQQLQDTTLPGLNSITKGLARDFYPLTSPQNRLYFLHQFDTSSLAYNLPQAVRLRGSVDKQQLQKAFLGLINRHDSLRTAFHLIDEEPVQQVLSEVDFDIDYMSATTTAVPELIKNYIRPFELNKAPLMRAGLIELATDEYILVVDMHHIITDGVSQEILIRDFKTLYSNETLPPLSLQYTDYAQWQRSEVQQKIIAAQKEFWVREFANTPPVLDLLTDFPRPLLMGSEGESIRFEVDAEQMAGLRAIAEQHGVTMFMMLLAVYNILLSKLSNQHDIIVGVPITGRPATTVNDIIGMFVNTLPLRNDLRGSQTVPELLTTVKARSLSCFEHQFYPYENLIEELKIERNTGRNPLFDTMFAYQVVDQPLTAIADLAVLPYAGNYQTAKFDLSLLAFDSAGKLHATFEYSTRLFKRSTIERITAYFKNIITGILENSHRTLSSISLINEGEQATILNSFNSNEPVKLARDEMYGALFAKQAALHAASIAVLHNDRSITYIQLYQQALKLSACLQPYGVQANTRVAIYMPRGIDMLVSILGVFFAGAAYVPIETEYPAGRVDEILSNSEALLVIADAHTAAILRTRHAALPIVEVEAVLQQQTPATITPINTRAGDLAYMIYTSGTTGKPKGVQITQLGMLNHLFAKIEDLGIDAQDIIAQTASCCFDISVWQFLAVLLKGGQVCIIDKTTVLDAGLLLQVLHRSGITIFESVPSLMVSFLENTDQPNPTLLSRLRWMIPTGEALRAGLVKKWYGAYPSVPLLNAYGPTEAGDDITHYVVPHADADTLHVPVGKPIRNMRVYILDGQNRICGIGVRGVICVAGPGVGKGYWKDEQKTNASFVVNPFSSGDPDYEVLYKTGDIGYYREDGNIICLGRVDEQVKVRGYRIEPAEIEHCLCSYAAVRACVVVVKELSGEPALVAYYLAEQAIDEKLLTDHLQQFLPAYMIPTYYVHIQEIPVTANGKLRRDALPDPQAKEILYQPPITDTEKKLVHIWSQVLKIDADAVGTDRSFFELGGHSLRATALVSRMKKEFDIEILLREVFILPTVQQMAGHIDNKKWVLGKTEKNDALSNEIILD